MDAAVIETSVFNLTNPPVMNLAEVEAVPSASTLDAKELAFELGLWLSGLENFLNVRNHSLADESRARVSTRDWTKEFHLTHSTILLCSGIVFRLGKALKDKKSTVQDDVLNLDADDEDLNISPEEVFKLAAVLKDAVLLSEGLLRAAPLKFGEWTAWSNSLSERFRQTEAFEKLIVAAEKTGEQFLPARITELLETTKLSFSTEADLNLILPRFAKILKWLSVIERMLEKDEPLKPSLLIFSRIREQIREMMDYVNNRLLRFADESDALFGALDGASYAASIELRKVYSHELAGLSELRQTPLIYAKIETAFALLNDSFQLTLINFAQVINPNVQAFDIFPKIKTKFEQSQILRHELWKTLKEVKKAEENPDKYPLPELHKNLTNFSTGALKILFYKDRETVERFIEEVLITTDKKDLVPILHRFGAYLETLFGQVNMRVVLANHPFEYEK